MNKLHLLLLLLIPLATSAQLEKVKPGMTLEEVKKNFPGMKQDISAMSSWIFTKDTMYGIKGVSEYVIQQDTLLRHDFISTGVSGPCKDYPNADSINYAHLLSAAHELYNQYSLLYGKPAEYYSQSPLADDTGRVPVAVYFAKWKQGENELSVSVNRQGKNRKFLMNSPPPTEEEMKPGCMYSLEILSIGTGENFEKACENGITGQALKKLHPNLAAQVENHPDSWTTEDTLASNHGSWEFSFVNGYLNSYSLDIYDGSGYFHKTDSAYSLLRNLTLTLFAEAKKMNGKPAILINKLFPAYPGKGSKLYHHSIYFESVWKYNTENLYVLFDETSGGKQFDPIFRLMVYFGKPITQK